MQKIFLLGLVALVLACEAKKEAEIFKNVFESGESVGSIIDEELLEVSGISASINNPGYLWVHNDSGDEARIFLIDDHGRIVTTVWLANTINRDWEDMAVGPGPEDGKVYVYVGDIGDNGGIFETKVIYRIEEPVIDVSKTRDTVITNIDRIMFQLPDGALDTELLMLDPLTRDLFILSKRKKKVSIYRIPYPQSVDTVSMAEILIPQRNLNNGNESTKDGEMIDGYNAQYYYQIVAGDISPDGSEVLIKSYSAVYYWKREEGESIRQLLQRNPMRLPYEPEPQGEAIGFDAKGKGYYTISEKRGSSPVKLIFYNRKK